jgi:hypothetical protein
MWDGSHSLHGRELAPRLLTATSKTVIRNLPETVVKNSALSANSILFTQSSYLWLRFSDSVSLDSIASTFHSMSAIMRAPSVWLRFITFEFEGL